MACLQSMQGSGRRQGGLLEEHSATIHTSTRFPCSCINTQPSPLVPTLLEVLLGRGGPHARLLLHTVVNQLGALARTLRQLQCRQKGAERGSRGVGQDARGLCFCFWLLQSSSGWQEGTAGRMARCGGRGGGLRLAAAAGGMGQSVAPAGRHSSRRKERGVLHAPLPRSWPSPQHPWRPLSHPPQQRGGSAGGAAR